MRPELEEIQLLERFLNGHLPGEAERDVQIRLLWDQEWQQKLELQQLAYGAIVEAGRQKLRRELQTIHQSLFG